MEVNSESGTRDCDSITEVSSESGMPSGWKMVSEIYTAGSSSEISSPAMRSSRRNVPYCQRRAVSSGA